MCYLAENSTNPFASCKIASVSFSRFAPLLLILRGLVLRFCYNLMLFTNRYEDCSTFFRILRIKAVFLFYYDTYDPSLSSIYQTRYRNQLNSGTFPVLKGEVIEAIARMKQDSRTTDLQSTLDVALDLLRDQPGATKRVLIMGTDYLTDHGSANPNPPTSPIRAAGVDALLLVAYPKPECLRGLRLGASSLLRIVETKWAAHFEDGGAHSVSVHLVDAAYASTQGSSILQRANE